MSSAKINDDIVEAVRQITLAYQKETGAAMSTISRKVYGNTAFLDDFFVGKRTIQIDKLGDIIEAFTIIWPAGLPWPVSVIEVRPTYDRPLPTTSGGESPKPKRRG